MTQRHVRWSWLAQALDEKLMIPDKRPTIEERTNEKVIMPLYHHIPLRPVLQTFLREILIQDPQTADNSTTYNVLPTLYPVMGFQYQGQLELIGETTTAPLARSGITGL
jgi:hypothetical protein